MQARLATRVLTGAALGAAILLTGLPGTPLDAGTADAKRQPGVYVVWGSAADAGASYVRGGQIVVQWSDVQPGRRRFDWSSLDRQLRTYHRLGKGASVQINSTDSKPRWLWKRVDRCGKTKGQAIPRYWTRRYLKIQSRLVDGLAHHLRRSKYRRVVTVVRASPNAIGTELTTLPPGASCRGWSAEEGRSYFKKVMNLYRKALAPRFNVALRAQTFTTRSPRPPLRWLGPHVWIMGTASDIDPNPTRDAFDVLAERWARTDRTRAYWEPHYTHGKQHLVSWNYWRLLLELQKGVAYVAVYGDQIRRARTDREYRRAFDFVNRYAGSHARPGEAPGAWVALREGTGRTAGNFGWFMAQLDPDGTSVALDSANGRRPIGADDQRFGRFARRIEGGTQRDAMSFRLGKKFRRGIRSADTTLRVTYLDAGSNEFTVRWGAGPRVTTVRTAGTGRWETVAIPVAGSAYEKALPGESDVVVTAAPGSTATLHMVEVRVTGR